MNIALKFKILRTLLNQSQKELASTLGISNSSLYLYEAGKRDPRSSLLVKIDKLIKENMETNRVQDDSLDRVLQSHGTTETRSSDVIELQRENILLLKEKIQNLEKRLNILKNQRDKNVIVNEQTSTFNLETSFIIHENEESDLVTDNIKRSGNGIFSGNTLCLGYTPEEMTKMSTKEVHSLYHPQSQKDGMKTLMLLNEDTNNVLSVDGHRILQSKDGTWVTFDCHMVFERNRKNRQEWLMRAYFKKLAGDNA